MLRIRDVYPGFRILIFAHPKSRIPDPKTAMRDKGDKKNFSYLFFIVQNGQWRAAHSIVSAWRLKWSRGGSIHHWSQIRITLMTIHIKEKSRIWNRIKVKRGIRIRSKEKRGIQIRIEVMRIRNSVKVFKKNSFSSISLLLDPDANPEEYP